MTTSRCNTSAVVQKGQQLGATLPVGTALAGGRYRIIRLLKQGSFGAVYAAGHVRLNGQLCAVKEVRDDGVRTPQEQAEVQAWFDREVSLLMSLHHPMIPNVIDRFTEAGRHYLVMDYVEGRDLAEELRARGTPFPEAAVLAWSIALCNVLGYLHALPKPLIFRDLKPDNIMLTPSGNLFLVDFGIARQLATTGAGGTSRPGTMIGTPGYAPLEQYQGMAEPRGDIYALGATLHRLLTGYDPEKAPPLSFPPARQLRPDIQPAPEEFVAPALALKPQDRFADATAIEMALRHVKDALNAQARSGLSRPSLAQQARGSSIGALFQCSTTPSAAGYIRSEGDADMHSLRCIRTRRRTLLLGMWS
jgi:serine/threonine protein kinase